MITLETNRLIIRQPSLDDIDLIVQYRIENRSHLEPIEPQRPDNFYTKEHWASVIQEQIDAIKKDRGYSFLIFEKDSLNKLCGVVNLSNVVRLAFQACYLGYSLGAIYENRGYMSESLERVLKYAFEELNLHRIMANYIPSNKRSKNVLIRLGFTQEGVAKNYLRINGEWHDHILTSITNDKWRDE